MLEHFSAVEAKVAHAVSGKESKTVGAVQRQDTSPTLINSILWPYPALVGLTSLDLRFFLGLLRVNTKRHKSSAKEIQICRLGHATRRLASNI